MTDHDDRERRLADLLSDFIDAVNEGRAPDLGRWAARDPEIANDFREMAHTVLAVEELGLADRPTTSPETAASRLAGATPSQPVELPDRAPLDERPDFLLMVLRRCGAIWGKLRWQKTVFLGGKETSAGSLLPDFYPFAAYNFGPFEDDVEQDTAALEQVGLVDRSPPPVRRTRRGQVAVGLDGPQVDHVYKLTPRGERLADALIETARQEHPGLLAEIDELASRLKRMNTDQLLHYVYEKYPDYTTESLIRDEVLGPDEGDDR